MGAIYDLLKDTVQGWLAERAPRQAAALAYYAIFSLAPLLVIAISVAGIFFTQQSVQTDLINQIEQVIGPGAADFVATTLEQTYNTDGGILATLVSVALLFFVASNLFNQLKISLNSMWPSDTLIQDDKSGLVRFIIDRLIAFVMVLAVGALLVIITLINTLVPVFIGQLQDVLPSSINLFRLAGTGVSLLLLTGVLSLLYRYLPDVQVDWRSALIGGFVTAVLTQISQYAISLYTELTNIASAYGAASSLIVILLWVFYIANIILFGAKLVQQVSCRYGDHAPDGPPPLK